jgi:predicted amidohydrolase
MTTFAIAGLQLEAPHADNTDAILAEIDKVMAQFPWLEMIVAPELACGVDRSCAQPLPNPTEQRFCEIAHSHGIWLIPGSFYESNGDNIYNTAPVINPDGKVISRYRKQFPWTPYEEGITPGSEFTVFDIPDVGRFGVSNCYDMCFPETIRTMAWMGAEVILHPSLTSREIIPLKLDLNYLRDVRENGWHNLGQPLKSFRDSKVKFPPYSEGYDSAALRALGELRMPNRENSK